MHLREPERFVDGTSSHRHDPFRKAGRVEDGASATAKKSNLDKRVTPNRNTRSSKFQRSLKIAKSCRIPFMSEISKSVGNTRGKRLSFISQVQLIK